MTAEPAAALEVHAWLDVACPWCWIAKRRFEAAVAEYGGAVDLTYHSFELAPDLPADHVGQQVDYLRRQYPGRSDRELEQMMRLVTTTGAQLGLEYHFDRVRHTSTFRAHQLLHHARAQGRQSEVLDALFRAYFAQGQDVRDLELLAGVAANAGLDRAQAREAVASGRHADAVRADRELARTYGVTRIPTYVVAGQPPIHGAKKPRFFVDALHRAAEEAELDQGLGA
ncbi:DsbA family oxidoreductase [Georgenia subflava]|uniref:DsbA family oxidoreductase n=1 Tax=Georgenia subflava TaxID=1622177 RepID=UPI00186B11EA|nr:DsbA family oxidoreductase [Georgenia subflava]